MKRVDRSELLELGKYEEIRERFRARVIQEKKPRRVALGPNMTVLFENHDTVLFQIQEMLRTERITSEAAIQHELDTYNQLIPDAAELSATLFIEYAEREERERMLTALAGVERTLHLLVDGERCPCDAELRGERTDRTTAVHYVKFALGERAWRAIQARSAAVSVVVDHPAYRAEARLSDATLRALAEDSAEP